MNKQTVNPKAKRGLLSQLMRAISNENRLQI